MGEKKNKKQPDRLQGEVVKEREGVGKKTRREIKDWGTDLQGSPSAGYNPEKNLFNMQPEKSEVAGNSCHKTPIRSEVGEKQTERADMHLGDKIRGSAVFH